MRNRHLTARRETIHEYYHQDGFGAIEYLPTREMVAYVLTKPLEGTQFQKFGTAIMGWANI